MRKKFLKLVCICAMVSSLVMGGCGDTQETKDSTNETATTKESDTKEDTTSDKSGEYPYGTFDIDEICKHIEINGKQVDFPFTLNDLGEDYEFSRCEEYVEGIYSGYISYKGEEILGMSSKESEILSDKSVINDISSRSGVDSHNSLTICGIGKGSSVDEVVNVFGEPTDIIDGSISTMYIYKVGKIYVCFSSFANKKEIDTCQIILEIAE